MSVLIAIPGLHVENDVAVALWKLDKAGHDVDIAIQSGYDVADQRDDLVAYALGKGYSYMLFVDSDTAPPPNALADMLSHDVDVCLGYYQHSGEEDGLTCIWKPSESGVYSGRELHDLEARGEYLVEAWRGGLGCALVKASVFSKLSKPYFSVLRNADGTKLSEDYYFCSACRRAGLKVYTDTRVACRHVIKRTVGI